MFVIKVAADLCPKRCITRCSEPYQILPHLEPSPRKALRPKIIIKQKMAEIPLPRLLNAFAGGGLRDLDF